jgi:hypothetical protein
LDNIEPGNPDLSRIYDDVLHAEKMQREEMVEQLHQNISNNHDSFLRGKIAAIDQFEIEVNSARAESSELFAAEMEETDEALGQTMEAAYTTPDTEDTTATNINPTNDPQNSEDQNPTNDPQNSEDQNPINDPQNSEDHSSINVNSVSESETIRSTEDNQSPLDYVLDKQSSEMPDITDDEP